MYEIGNEICFVKMLKFFLFKMDLNVFYFFNKCVKDVIFYLKDCNIWYIVDFMKKWLYVNFFLDICKVVGCKCYIVYCLRVIVI